MIAASLRGKWIFPSVNGFNTPSSRGRSRYYPQILLLTSNLAFHCCVRHHSVPFISDKWLWAISMLPEAKTNACSRFHDKLNGKRCNNPRRSSANSQHRPHSLSFCVSRLTTNSSLGRLQSVRYCEEPVLLWGPLFIIISRAHYILHLLSASSRFR